MIVSRTGAHGVCIHTTHLLSPPPPAAEAADEADEDRHEPGRGDEDECKVFKAREPRLSGVHEDVRES